MYTYPESVTKLIEAIAAFPGIGPKSASRIGLSLTIKNKELLKSLIPTIEKVLEKTAFCNICGTLIDSGDDKCSVCKDETRGGVLIIVESPLDMAAIEALKVFAGRYHVLNGLVSPLKAVGLTDLNLQNLPGRIDQEGYSEITFALPASVEGDTTALLVKKLLSTHQLIYTRLGRGLPTGAYIEYLDSDTLRNSLVSKSPF